MADNFLSGRWQSAAQIQWNPGLTAHDPNPPITLEGAPQNILNPTGIASQEAFGTPSVTVANTITATGIASEEAFGTPYINAEQTIICAGIASEEAFGTANLVSNKTITCSSIDSAEQFGLASVTTVTPPVPPAPPAAPQPCYVFGIGPCVGSDNATARLPLKGRSTRMAGIAIGTSGSADSVRNISP